ncbi:MAG: sigma-70 family RNA polymerase sigma factor [Planctomycetes bacterium]|nr:sigma-70 family RNA polymerase sigma factor [Planctomycetota bacterium]
MRALLMKEFGGEAARDAAEDAMSAALHRIWSKIDAFEPERASLRTWFYVIARNRLRSRRKAERNHLLAAELDLLHSVAEADDAEGDRLPSARVLALESSISRLRGLQREIILADLEAGGVAEASELARAFDTSTNTIYVTRSKARRQLREWIVESETRGGRS